MGKAPSNLKQILDLIADKLSNYTYAFRGTASLILHGLDMNVSDIDILCDKKCALDFNELFKDYVVDPVAYSENDKFKSYFGKFKIDKIPVEVMGEWQIKDTKGNWSEIYNGSNREKVDNYWVTPIGLELSCFAKMGRWNAFHKIKRELGDKTQYKKKSNQLELF